MSKPKRGFFQEQHTVVKNEASGRDKDMAWKRMRISAGLGVGLCDGGGRVWGLGGTWEEREELHRD